jgi:RHS repeat-associated protein
MNSLRKSIGNAKNTAFFFANLSGYRGKIRYEMSKHLGNVLTVVSDKKLAVCSNGSFVSYTAEVISATDYSPFGAPLAGRTFSSESYRFRFNGKENDKEIYGDGNALDFGARIYDSRLGRWLSVDRLTGKHPDESPFIFAGNIPVKFVDFDGNDYGVIINHKEGTILIVANIYTIDKTGHDQVLNAVADINNLKRTATFEGKKYAVSFKIEVDPEGKSIKNSLDDPIGNSYFGVRGLVEFQNGEAVGGFSDGKSFAMNSIYYQQALSDGSTATQYHNAGNNTDLVSHEILHLLGLDDKDKGKYYSPDGRMNYVAKPPDFSLAPISNSDILNIIKFAIENNGKPSEAPNPMVSVEQKEGVLFNENNLDKISITNNSTE